MAGDWRALNLANWEARVPVHLGRGGYDLTGFADPEFLSTVVRYDRPHLGECVLARNPERLPLT